jgi:hypothetical protein
MKRISAVMFLFASLFAAPLLRADVITVLKPVAGTYKAGTTMEISWTFQFMEWLPSTAAQKQLVISLWQYDKSNNGPVMAGYEDIATVDVNTGHYSWKVGNYSTNWDGFIFKVHMKENTSLSALSQPFQIERALVIQKIPTPAALARIFVTAPAENQRCKIGTKVMIRWDKANISTYGYVWLQVCWPNHTKAGGAFPTSNTGSYEWAIAETAENTLCVEVYTQDNKYKGFSGNFKVVF